MWQRWAAVGITVLLFVGVWAGFTLLQYEATPDPLVPSPYEPGETPPRTGLGQFLAGQDEALNTSPLWLPGIWAQATPAPVPDTSIPDTPVSDPAVSDAIGAGLGFLRGQYRAEAGFLQESPRIGALRFYLANDNLLARVVLAELGGPEDREIAARIGDTLALYPEVSDDFIRIAWGEPIDWPLRHHRDSVVKQLSEKECDRYDDALGVDATGEASPDQGPCILTEGHKAEYGHFYDWSSYANLTFMQVSNLIAQGEPAGAEILYRLKRVDFNGRGFADKPYWEYLDANGEPLHWYETLGLAWAVYAAALLDDHSAEAALLVERLLAQQDPVSGGFHTHFSDTADRLVDANVETTSVALLALAAWNGDHLPRPPADLP